MVERSSCAALLGMELRRFICTQCRMPNCFVQYLSCFRFYSENFKTDQIMLRTTDTGTGNSSIFPEPVCFNYNRMLTDSATLPVYL